MAPITHFLKRLASVKSLIHKDPRAAQMDSGRGFQRDLTEEGSLPNKPAPGTVDGACIVKKVDLAGAERGSSGPQSQ